MKSRKNNKKSLRFSLVIFAPDFYVRFNRSHFLKFIQQCRLKQLHDKSLRLCVPVYYIALQKLHPFFSLNCSHTQAFVNYYYKTFALVSDQFLIINQNCIFFFILSHLSAGELGNAVQDAFVIAVEQQARERLQRLSALKRITPVDMSQLSIKVISRS